MSNPEKMIEVDTKKVNSLIRKIIVAEAKNIKSNEKTGDQMAQEIRKMIEEVAKCY